MRQIVLLLIAMGFTATALAQGANANPDVHDWNRVRSLARGEFLRVKQRAGGTLYCRFDGATDETLFCTFYGSFSRGNEVEVERDSVAEIRRDDRGRNAKIAIGGMAAAGFVAGMAIPLDKGYRPPAILRGLGGAVLGGLAGVVVAVPTAILVPGRVVYRAPGDEQKGAQTKSDRRQDTMR